MIFSSKLKVCQSHGNKGSDYNQNNEDDEQNAINRVDPVTPDTGKYVVEFNIYSTEGQKSCHCHLRKSTPVPWQWGNFSRVLRCTAWRLEFSLAILPSNATQYKEW
uniref:Uncharacterized protein n=1 Tax=Opuntia streptacantha TaxID=393608 RepID=A0A7C9ELI9_OPUST